MLRILGISGSLRRGSHNTSLLRAAAELLPPGVELERHDGLRELPPYDPEQDLDPADPAVSELRDPIASADGALIATPEYNGSIPAPVAGGWAPCPHAGAGADRGVHGGRGEGRPAGVLARAALRCVYMLTDAAALALSLIAARLASVPR